MPLIQSHTTEAFKQNVREMIAAGHPPRQAVAAAERIRDEARKKKKKKKT